MKYTKDQVNKMREIMATRDVEQCDEGTLFDVFMEGCTGWGNFDDDFVIVEFENHYGKHYFSAQNP